MNQCKCEPFENASMNASVLRTLNLIRRPSLSCLLTISGRLQLSPPKSTSPVLLYTIRWKAFTAVTSCTDAHRFISSIRRVCVASIWRILHFDDKRIVSGTIANTASMLLPMQTKMSNEHCISLVHGLYLVTDIYIKLEFSVAVRGQFIRNFLHNPTVSFEFWTIFLVWFLNLQKPTRARAIKT